MRFFSTLALFFIVIFVDFAPLRHGRFLQEDTSFSFTNTQNLWQISPKKPYCNGLGLFIKDSSNIDIKITDDRGNLVFSTTSSIQDESVNELLEIDRTKQWFYIYFDKELKRNHSYSIKATSETNANFSLCLVFAKSVFSPIDKIVFSLFVLAIVGSFYFLPNVYLKGVSSYKRIPKKLKFALLFLLLFALMLHVFKASYEKNSSGSEALVTGALHSIYAHCSDKRCNYKYAFSASFIENDTHDYSKYGLGYFVNEKGIFDYPNNDSWLTDANYYKGYSRASCAITLRSTSYTNTYVKQGCIIEFSNKARATVSSTNKYNASYTEVHFSQNAPLCFSENGSLDYIKILDKNGDALPEGVLTCYTSQYGLHGRVYSIVARFFSYDMCIKLLRGAARFLCALTFMIIVVLVSKKYNNLMAICFYIAWLLCPYSVKFSNSLYWVEFTWFLPMLWGLVASIYYKKKLLRYLAFFMIYISVVIKSLCGYEYITTVMLSSILFLVADFFCAVKNKENRLKSLAISIVCVGILCLLGFATAFILHSSLRGNGNITLGIKQILITDALRRTTGADFNAFPKDWWPSFNASTIDILKTYIFSFKKDIILGITGKLFPLLAILPIFIFSTKSKNTKQAVANIGLYITSLLSSLSWFILAKNHSFFHTHLNYVMWYFGFVQVSFYIIIDFALSLYKKRNRLKS